MKLPCETNNYAFQKGSSVLIPMFTLTADTPGKCVHDGVWIEMSYIHISTHEPLRVVTHTGCCHALTYYFDHVTCHVVWA